MFQIHVAHRHSLIQSTFAGFLTIDDVHDYCRDMAAVHARWFRFRSAYRLVIDATAAKIQPQEVLAGFAAHVESFAPAERIGVACGASLTRLQILRVLDRPYLRICPTLDDARRWAVGDVAIDAADLHLVAATDRSDAVPMRA